MKEHGWITAHKIFEEELKEGYCWAAELECRTLVQLCGFREDEKASHKLYCPVHRRLEEIMRVKQIPLEPEIA
jgi:hypothetical protein